MTTETKTETKTETWAEKTLREAREEREMLDRADAKREALKPRRSRRSAAFSRMLNGDDRD